MENDPEIEVSKKPKGGKTEVPKFSI